MDAAVGKLQADLGDIRAQLHKITIGSTSAGGAGDPSSLVRADATHLHTGGSGDNHRQFGHHRVPLPRVSASEGSLLATPVPANGGDSRIGAAGERDQRFSACWELERAVRAIHSTPPLPITLSAPPSVGRPANMSPTPSPLETRCRLDIAKSPAGSSPSVDDKLKDLRNFRKAQGLCFTCGEWWGLGHTCAPTVLLHIVEEMVGMLPAPTSPDSSLS